MNNELSQLPLNIILEFTNQPGGESISFLLNCITGYQVKDLIIEPHT